MDKKLLFLAFFSVIALIYIYSKQQFTNTLDSLDTFRNKDFVNRLNSKNRIIVCGNSPKFNESFEKIPNPYNNTFIIRFNSVLDHLDKHTDALFISNDVYKNYDKSKIQSWKKKTNVYLVDSLIKQNSHIFDKYNKINLTSGMIILLFLIDNIDPSKITIAGFDLPSDYNTNANWYGDNKVWGGHDINLEKQLLITLIKKNNIMAI